MRPSCPASRLDISHHQIVDGAGKSKNREAGCARGRFLQDLHPLRHELPGVRSQASDVAAWARQTGDQSPLDGVTARCHDERDRGGRLSGGFDRQGRNRDDVDPATEKVRGEPGKRPHIPFGPSNLQVVGLPLDVTNDIEAAAQRLGTVIEARSGAREHSDACDLPRRLRPILLRLGRERRGE